jgi:phospholipid transport system transporter-binding protein
MQLLQNQCESALALTGSLDINSVDEVYKVLLKHLEQNDSISVDLSQIESCDTAGAQLLLALGKSTESSGKPFAVVAASEAFVRDCAGLGISMATLAPSPMAQKKPEDMGTKKNRNHSKKKSTQNVAESANA